MSISSIFTIYEAQRQTGESRHLINYLIRDRQIPVVNIGVAKVLDDQGMEQLRRAIADYRSKPEPAATS